MDTYGKKWRKISEFFPGRTDKQIRERYENVLSEVARNSRDVVWTIDLDRKLLQCIAKYGLQWSKISEEMQFTPTKLRNRWNCRLRALVQTVTVSDVNFALCKSFPLGHSSEC